MAGVGRKGAVNEFAQGGLMTLPEYLVMVRGDGLWTKGNRGIGAVRRTERSLNIVPDKLCLTLHYQQRPDYLLQLGTIPLAPEEPMEVDQVPAVAAPPGKRGKKGKRGGKATRT